MAVTLGINLGVLSSLYFSTKSDLCCIPSLLTWSSRHEDVLLTEQMSYSIRVSQNFLSNLIKIVTLLVINVLKNSKDCLN